MALRIAVSASLPPIMVVLPVPVASGGGVGAGGVRQRAVRGRIAGEQRHNDARPGGGQCETAKGYHSNHPLGAFSLF